LWGASCTETQMVQYTVMVHLLLSIIYPGLGKHEENDSKLQMLCTTKLGSPLRL